MSDWRDRETPRLANLKRDLAECRARIRELEAELHNSHKEHAKTLSTLGDRTIRLGEVEAEREQQAREIERLKDDLSRVRSVYDFAKQATRIAELEARPQPEDLKIALANAIKERDKFWAERNAIEAKTIEQCRQALDGSIPEQYLYRALNALNRAFPKDSP